MPQITNALRSNSKLDILTRSDHECEAFIANFPKKLSVINWRQNSIKIPCQLRPSPDVQMSIQSMQARCRLHAKNMNYVCCAASTAAAISCRNVTLPKEPMISC
ncbi:hypothetical protein MHU86_15453 [Fragilaria crotonensis]|nr:hypothetical protein MHU86_15453 [Fragilaria crotonensis]